MTKSRCTHKYQEKRSADGVTNWLRLMLILSLIILVLDNYNRFGIIIYPHEVIRLVCETVYGHLWLYGIILLCILQQTIQAFFIEKLLSLNLVSEFHGMILHAINSFFVAVALIITVRLKEANLGVIRTLTPTVVLCSIAKTWSYAFVNKNLRKQAIQGDGTQENKKNGNDGVASRYPNNITPTNLLTYMVCTPSVQYKLSYKERSYPTLKDCARQLLFAFSVICGITFLSKQFILPELDLLKLRHYKGSEMIQCLIRIMIFVHILWLLGYVLFYRIFHPTYAIFTGFPHLTFETDWWNASTMDEFWRRWNRPVYVALKDTVMIPLLQRKYSKAATKTISFIIAGVLHEFINTLPLGIYNGSGMFTTLTEMPLGYASMYITRKFGANVGNTLVWAFLNFTHTVSIVYVYLNYEVF